MSHLVKSAVSVDDIVKLIDAVTKLLNVLVWPAVLLFILIRFGRDLREFIASLGELSLKGAGFEASLKRKQAEAAAALAAATASQTHEEEVSRESAVKEAGRAADIVSEIVTPRVIRRASKATVLWADDYPNNNIYERQALEALGVNFVLATSTEEALSKIAQRRFDAIISDMGRPPDPRAGYTLLDKLRSSGNQTPFIIYAAKSRSPELVEEARRRGALGSTSRPNELFEMVLFAVSQ